jgi:N-acetylmuramoyl-L-alanine amidase
MDRGVLAKPPGYVENVLVTLKRVIAYSILILMACASAGSSGAWAAGRVRTVVLDAGHGGFDTGIRSGGLKEKDLMLQLVQLMRTYLGGQGKEVRLTRRVDQYMGLGDRRSETVGADLFVSLHLTRSADAIMTIALYDRDAADLSLAEYYSFDARQMRYQYESKALGAALASVLRDRFGLTVMNRRMPLALLTAVGAPAVLLELPVNELDFHQESLELLARALVDGILAYERQ